MFGVSLSTGVEGYRKKKHSHLQFETWEITSDYTIADVPFCPVTTRVLPGRLGTYIYPDDAVLTCSDLKVTKKCDFDRVLQQERSNRTEVCHINHMSVATDEVDANGVDEVSDEDEEDVCEDDDGECEDVGEQLWEDDDEPDWNDKSK